MEFWESEMNYNISVKVPEGNILGPALNPVCTLDPRTDPNLTSTTFTGDTVILSTHSLRIHSKLNKPTRIDLKYAYKVENLHERKEVLSRHFHVEGAKLR